MTSPQDEFTELVDADIPRVDLVDKAANGTRFLIAKQADGARGLLAPDLVRDLVGKATAEPAPQETVTMTGSPAAIAKMIHEAAVRRAQAEQTISLNLTGTHVAADSDFKQLVEHIGERIGKADMSTKNINDLPDSDFAYIEPGGEKDEGGRTTPRSLRHFPIHDEAHVRNALSRAPQSPFGDKAMPKIRAAAKKFGIDTAVTKEMDMDDEPLDVMTALAEADGDHAGMDTDPGSPAWEAIDAATACKWTAILARARNAIDMLAEREMLEAAAGDECDADNAFDLQDACCAIDYAISVLAPFAVAEQAEADCGDDMQMVGKALAQFDAAGLDTIEALATVTKAGRVLSSANEQAIRGAVESLQKVLASLPSAPTAPVEKEAGEPVPDKETDMPESTTSAETVADHGETPTMGVAKADGDKPAVVVVYDQKGRLIGIVDPTDVTPVANAEADADDMDEPAADTTDQAPAETPDLTPQPPAEAGTPADAVTDDDTVTKTTHENDTLSEMFKSSLLAAVESAFAEHSANQNTVLAKQADAVLELASMVETLKGRIGALEEQPAEPRVFTNGAVPADLRGMDRGAAARIDLAKAREQKDRLYKAADATEQNRIAQDMQASAIDALQAIHQRRA